MSVTQSMEKLNMDSEAVTAVLEVAQPDHPVRALVDYSYLSTATRDQRIVRAAHQIYEHLICLWAPAIMETAHDLGFFTRLAEQPSTAAEVSAHLGTDLRATHVLLDGLAAYGLVERSVSDGGTRYALAEEIGHALLTAGVFSVAGKMIYDRKVAWDAWRDLPAAVLHGTRDESADNRTNQISAADYEDLVTGINFWAPPIVEILADALAYRGWKRERAVSVLDVGCGTGLYSHLLLQRFPLWTATGMDVTQILRIAHQQAKRLGVSSRFTGLAGNFHADGWDASADLILFANIFHLQADQAAEELLLKAAQALTADGLICIIDQIVVDDAHPATPQDRFAMLFSVSMLATGGGGCYSLDSYDRWLSNAGLERVALLDAPMHRLLLARRADS